MSQHLRTSTRPPASSYDAVVVGAHPAGAAARDAPRPERLEHVAPAPERPERRPLRHLADLRGAALLLARWGLLDAVLAAGTTPVRRTIFRYGDEKEVISVQPSHGVDVLCAPTRSVLEPLLVGRAVDAAWTCASGPRSPT